MELRSSNICKNKCDSMCVSIGEGHHGLNDTSNEFYFRGKGYQVVYLKVNLFESSLVECILGLDYTFAHLLALLVQSFYFLGAKCVSNCHRTEVPVTNKSRATGHSLVIYTYLAL